MISSHLLEHLARRHAPFLAASAFLFAGFQFLICAAVISARVGTALEALMKSLPPVVQEVLTSQLFGGLSPQGLLAFGWNHPISHALGTAVAIVLASRAVAGEIESGTLELLLSQPLSRASYLGTQLLFAGAALALLSLAGIAGTYIGQSFYGMEPFRSGQLLRLAANFFLLQAAWFGITLAFSTFGREGGRIAAAGFLLALASYIAQVIGRLWSAAAFVLPWSLHTYFAPQQILLGPTSLLRPVCTLLVVTIAAAGVGMWQFQRRDLP